jgi:transposase-like protein
MNRFPDFYRRFPTEADCISHLERVRWNGTPVCPYCNSPRSTKIPRENRYRCNNCNVTYSVTVKTVFDHTHLPLQKWFLAISLTLDARKGISARQLATDLKINKNTAWFLLRRISNAMLQPSERELLLRLITND